MSLINKLFSYTTTNLETMSFNGYKESFKISTGNLIQPKNSPLGKLALQINLSSSQSIPRKEGVQVSTATINVGQEIILQPFLSTNYMPVNDRYMDNSFGICSYDIPNIWVSSLNTGDGLIQDTLTKINKCTYPGPMSVTLIGNPTDNNLFKKISNNKLPISSYQFQNLIIPNLGLPFVLSTCAYAGLSTKTKPYYQTISTLCAYTRDLGVGLYLTTAPAIGPRFIGNTETFKTNPNQGAFKDEGISFGDPLNVLGISKVYSLNGNMPLLGVISNQPDIENYISLQFNEFVICGGNNPSGYTISLSTTQLSVAGPEGSNIVNPELSWEVHRGDIIGVCHINPTNTDWQEGTFYLGTLVIGTSARLSKITFMNELQSSLSDTPSKYPTLCNNMPCIGEPLVFSSTESNAYTINITSKHVPWIADPFINKAPTPALYSILMRLEFVDLVETKTINIKADSTSVNTIKLNGTAKTLPYTEIIKY